jgi:hypothetical protein
MSKELIRAKENRQKMGKMGFIMDGDVTDEYIDQQILKAQIAEAEAEAQELGLQIGGAPIGYTIEPVEPVQPVEPVASTSTWTKKKGFKLKLKLKETVTDAEVDDAFLTALEKLTIDPKGKGKKKKIPEPEPEPEPVESSEDEPEPDDVAEALRRFKDAKKTFSASSPLL